MYLGPIQADRAQLQHASFLREQEDLHKEILEVLQEGAPKCCQRIMIRMQIPGDEAEWHRLIRSSLDLTRAEHPGSITVEEQAQ